MNEVQSYETNEIDRLILGNDNIKTYVYRGICKQENTITFIYIYGPNLGCFAIYGAKIGFFEAACTKESFESATIPIVYDRTPDMKLLITIIEELTTSLTGCELSFGSETTPAAFSVNLINNLRVIDPHDSHDNGYLVIHNIKDITMPLRCLTSTVLRLYNNINDIYKARSKLANPCEKKLTQKNANLKQQLSNLYTSDNIAAIDNIE